MFCFIFLLIINVLLVQCIDVDPEKTQLYGPGLKPHTVVLPARYFFIQAYDTSSNRLNVILYELIFFLFAMLLIYNKINKNYYCFFVEP